MTTLRFQTGGGGGISDIPGHPSGIDRPAIRSPQMDCSITCPIDRTYLHVSMFSGQLALVRLSITGQSRRILMDSEFCHPRRWVEDAIPSEVVNFFPLSTSVIPDFESGCHVWGSSASRIVSSLPFFLRIIQHHFTPAYVQYK